MRYTKKDMLNLLIYVLAFVALAIGSNLIVTTIRRFTNRIKVPPFVFSFFVVGMLTSVGEIAVAINAVSINRPEIFVGSLLGGTLIIFSVILPVAIILARGLRVHKHLSPRKLLVVLAIIGAPAVVALDHTVSTVEAIVLVALYVLLFFVVKAPAGTLERVERVFQRERRSLRENTVLRLVLGGLVVFLASRDIVTQTVSYSATYHISDFVVSLIVIAIGMNLPELTLAIRAGLSKDQRIQDIAVGDLMGSAAANVLIMGAFSLISINTVVAAQNFIAVFVFIILTLALFYIFTLGRKKLTPMKGLALLALYILFVGLQFLLQKA